MARRLLVIANPAAGRVRSGRLRAVLAELNRLGCETVLRQPDLIAASHLTSTIDGATGSQSGTGAIEHLARSAEPEFDLIVAAGGDGTVNGVANGMAGTSRPMGVLPLGTVNLLAREIAMPREPAAIARVLATAPAKPIWPGTICGRLFLMVASAGIDAATVAAVPPCLKRRIGRVAFIAPAVGQLRSFPRQPLTVHWDNGISDAALVIASRGRLYGGPFIVAPAASLAHPELHLTLLPAGDSASMLKYLRALAGNRLPQYPGVVQLRCRKAVLEAPWRMPVQADGEILGHLPAVLGISAEPLMLIQPC